VVETAPVAALLTVAREPRSRRPGPVGRTAAAAVMPVAAVYSYSRSKGLFAGVSVTGTVIATRDGANEKYYGRKVTPAEILSGHVKPPASAAKLRKELAKF
jgi:lipid-binding SYLF domain-containing protein